MKLLLLGSGGREHALAWKIAQSPKIEKLYIAPGNAGTSEVGENVAIKADDFAAIKEFVVKNDINMVVVGHEDPLVKGIYDYFKNGKAGKLRVFSSQFEEDEIPVSELFRTYEHMPLLEQTALDMAQGKILDVGAGSGCHSLALKQMGKKSVAIDISPLSVEVMQARGLDARLVNLFDTHFVERFDTILMLMYGSGIIGRVENFGDFFQRMKLLLNPGGCILMDSSDLRYLFEEEDGSFVVDLAGDYYGQLDFQMQYKQIKGEAFDWLYVDFNTLSLYASQYGFKAELVKEGSHYDYLAKLTL